MFYYMKLFKLCFGRTFIHIEVDGERKRQQPSQLDTILKSLETCSQRQVMVADLTSNVTGHMY